MTTLEIPPPPRRPARARIARALFERSVAGLERLEVIAPDGQPLRRQPGAPRMEIRSDAFFHRLAASGKIGFGEAYVAAEWAADDLVGVLSAFAERLSHAGAAAAPAAAPSSTSRCSRAWSGTRPPAPARNIARHYDLSNELFAALPGRDHDLLLRRVRAR